jgi:hypothetical protein
MQSRIVFIVVCFLIILMVSREIVLGTIKRMSAAGIDKETIKSTLHDIGLSEDEINSYFAEAGLAGAAPEAAPEPKGEEAAEEAVAEKAGEKEPEIPEEEPPEEARRPEKEHEAIARKTEERIAPKLEEMKAEHGMVEAAAKLGLEEHGEKLGELGKKIETVREKMPQSEHVSELAIRLKALEGLAAQIQQDLSDVKASSAALQSLMKKILETERRIVAALPHKK